MNIVLASGSPRRKEILESLGVTFTVLPSNCDETVDSRTSPADAVSELALRKANAVADQAPNSLVIGSDTVIDLDGRIVGKPQTDEDAAATLRELSGRAHIVRTAVAVVNTETNHSEVGASEARIQFRDLTDSEIQEYIATGEPMDKAGAYAIQGIGRSLVASVEGSQDTVIGFPREVVTQLLAKFDAI
jgi:septum formation protein